MNDSVTGSSEIDVLYITALMAWSVHLLDCPAPGNRIKLSACVSI